MAKFNSAMAVLPFSTKSRTEYLGISSVYFPKWGGWELLNKQEVDTALVDDLAYDFYKSYFWIKLKGSEIKDQHLANLLFVFATVSGKRKAIEKLQRSLVLKMTGVVDSTLTHNIHNRQSDVVFLAYYAEIVEFAVVTNNNHLLHKVLGVYYYWFNESAKR